MGALEERRIADCVMAHVFLAAVFGAPGLEDENVGSEQGFDRGQIAAGQGAVETLRYGDRGLCSDWDVDVRRCRGSGVMCVRLCRLRHCGGHDGQCQCEGERDCCCVHCVGSKEINGCAHEIGRAHV